MARAHLDEDLPQVALPRDAVVQERGVARRHAGVLGDHPDHAAGLEALDEAPDRVRVGDVDAQEEQIVRRQLAGEGHQTVPVVRRHEAQGDSPAVGERHGARISPSVRGG
jgi:hypothetical protein